MDDVGLLTAIGAGDRDAFAALYDQYARACYSLARRITIDPGLAEDAVQEAFLTVWRQASTYTTGRGKPGSWLVAALAHHKAVDAVRRQDRARRRAQQAEELTDWAAPVEPASPEQHLTQAEHRYRVLAALAPAQREVLVLAYFGGYTYPEIAAMTGTPLGTIKTRAHAACRHLRPELADLTE